MSSIHRAAVSQRAVWLGSTIVALACALPAYAQEAAQLPVIVVSPTGTPMPIDQVASSVTVITAADIARQQRRTMPEILALVPGLSITQAGPGALTSVFMRGTNSNHTKVLIDGIDVSDPASSNRAYDFGQLLTEDIERIEILRGPQSGLYGADAIGGVISIFTKRGEGPPRVTAMVEGGSHGTFNQSAGVSGGQDRISYAFNVAHYRATNIAVTPQEVLPPGQQARGNYYDNMTYSGRIGVDVNEYLSFNSTARYTEGLLRSTQDSGWPSAPNAEHSTSDIRQLFTRNEAVVTLLDGALVSYFGVNTTNHRQFNFGPGGRDASLNEGERVKYDWRSVAKVTPWQSFVVGGDIENESMRTSTVSGSVGNKGLYAQSLSQFGDRLFITANIRSDQHDAFGQHSTWRIAPAFIVPGTETKLKASYGTGFKAPTLYQLYGDVPAWNSFGNRNLKPEESRGFDAGFEQPLFNGVLRVGSTFFRNDISNLINSANIGGRFTYENVGDAVTEGTESFVALHPFDGLQLRADYTQMRAIDAVTGLQLLRRPKEKWSLTALWNPTEAWNVSATVLHVGSFVDGNRDFSIPRLDTKPYTLVNVAADYKVNDQVKLFARVDNLFDVRYQNPTGFLAPGLGVFGGVRVASFGVR